MYKTFAVVDEAASYLKTTYKLIVIIVTFLNGNATAILQKKQPKGWFPYSHFGSFWVVSEGWPWTTEKTIWKLGWDHRKRQWTTDDRVVSDRTEFYPDNPKWPRDNHQRWPKMTWYDPKQAHNAVQLPMCWSISSFFKMTASKEKINAALFMEEWQKYECKRPYRNHRSFRVVSVASVFQKDLEQPKTTQNDLRGLYGNQPWSTRRVATCNSGKPGLTSFFWNPSTFLHPISFISENEGTGQTKWRP